MSMMVSFVLSFFPRDVLDEILNLIESVSEDFPSYSRAEMTRLNFRSETTWGETYQEGNGFGRTPCYRNHPKIGLPERPKYIQ